MNQQKLQATAQAMVAPGKGLLAMDESAPTCEKRFKKLGIDCTEPNRRAYRDLLVTTPKLGDFVSGAILFDETIRQQTLDGTPFPEYMAAHGIMPGIKVDAGAKGLALHPGEKVTEGLDKLRERLAEYVQLGARFSKWRAVIAIGDDIPSRACIEANAHALARYAALCQEVDVVPIVEPEVLIDGDHSIEQCYDASLDTLRAVFNALHDQGVWLPGTILKASMVLSGLDNKNRAGVQTVAEQTVRCLMNTVPPATAGVAFLSGGQSDEEATAHLNAMNRLDMSLPWPLTFSYSRALQQQAMAIWKGDKANREKAQQALAHRARMNAAAARGEYNEAMEKQAA